MKLLNNTKIIFGAGAAVGVAVMGLLKTKKARELAVASLVSGRIIKDNILEEVSNIREDVDDAYKIAKGAYCEKVSEEA